MICRRRLMPEPMRLSWVACAALTLAFPVPAASLLPTEQRAALATEPGLPSAPVEPGDRTVRPRRQEAGGDPLSDRDTEARRLGLAVLLLGHDTGWADLIRRR